MKTFHFLLIAAVIATGSVLNAEEQARPDPAQLLEKAAQAKAEGRYDEARELYEKAQKLRVDPREGDHKKAGVDGKKGTEQLDREGKHDKIERRNLESPAAWEKPDGWSPNGKESDRFHHLAEAINHLRAAGFNEVADHLAQQTKQLHEEFEKKSGKSADEDKFALVAGEVQKLRDQVNKLTKEVDRLRDGASRSGGEGQKKD